MKQHITIEQLNELSKPSKKKLMNSIDNIFYLNAQKQFPGIATTHWHEDKNYLLSIGQMIEFLSKHREIVVVTNGLGSLTGLPNFLWKAGGGGVGENMEDNLKTSDELCDALWEAVKEVLDED